MAKGKEIGAFESIHTNYIMVEDNEKED